MAVYNIPYVTVNGAKHECFHSRILNRAYTSSISGSISTITQDFELGDEIFDLIHYFNSDGTLKDGYTSGQTILSFPSGTYLTLDRIVESGGAVIQGRVTFHYPNTASTNVFQVQVLNSSGFIQHAIFFCICFLNNDTTYSSPQINTWGIQSNTNSYWFPANSNLYAILDPDFLDENIPPEYTWIAWDQIAGYHGQYICDLTKIKATEIGDISALVQSSDVGVFDRLSPDSNIWDIYRNMPLDTDVTIAWSGVGYLMLRVSNVQGYDGWKDFTFKFFYREAFANVPFYTYTVRISVGVGGGDVRACYLAFVYDAEEGVAAFTPVFHTESNYFWGNVSNTAEEMGYLFMWLALSGSPESQKPYDTGTEDDGGNPSGVKPQDHIGTPATPTLDAAGSGLFTVYCPTDTELSHIADYLWDNDIIENMHKYFNNFSDNIISLYVLPYKPSNNLTKVFQVGNLQSSDSALAAVEYISGRFAKIDMGEYTITPFWDSYLDYSPYTKLEIYLPGVGIQSLDPDDIICPTNDDGTLPSASGSTLSLEYMIDLMTGILVAYVKVNSEVRYQFPGKVGYQIPLTGENYTRLMTGFVSATAGLIGTIATGGTAAPFAAAASTAGIINAMKPDTYRGGNLSGDASMLSGRTPFLIYRRPNKPRLTDQDKFTGFPSYKIDTLSNFSGYTEVIDCHVEGFNCTDEEREKILAALKGGVII